MLKDIRKNPLLLTDTYNLGHGRLKCNVDWETSHIYNRNSPMVLYGFQENVLDTLNIRIDQKMIDDAYKYAAEMDLDFPRDLFERVIDKCNGCIPISVDALYDGVWVPKGTPFAQVSNTMEGFGELVTWWEGMFTHSYFASACATEALKMREYLDNNRFRPTKIHSFGFRGHRSLEDAYWASTAWALFLPGTDDFHVKLHIPNEVKMGSILAEAHKVIQQFDKEFEAYKYAIEAIADKDRNGWVMLSMVIDTYDAWNFINKYMDRVVKTALDFKVHLVLRPDSGDVLSQAAKILQYKLEQRIEHLSVIIGEGMNFENILVYDKTLQSNGYDPNDVTYGIGGGYFNHITRDTLGWSMKTSYSNGKPRMKYASGKTSIPGRVRLAYTSSGSMIVYPTEFDYDKPLLDSSDVVNNLYHTIYYFSDAVPEDRPVTMPYDYSSIRARALGVLDDTEEHRQECIILSDETKQMMEDIKSQMLG